MISSEFMPDNREEREISKTELSVERTPIKFRVKSRSFSMKTKKAPA